MCPYECLTCVGPDPPSCSSCDSLMHRALSGGSCPCVAGYFDSGIALCQQCWYSCQTCSLSATMCTSCDSSAHRMQVATDCNCTVGFYDDGLHAVCLSCHYSCISCFGGTNTSCYTCQLNRNYTNYSCPCFLGMYELAGCSTCLPAHYLLGGVCYATCPLGYTSTFNQCTPCPTACSSCLWNACLSCSANFYLSADSECIAVGYFRNANE